MNRECTLAGIKEYGKLEALIDKSKQLLLYIDEIIKALPELSNVYLFLNSKVVSNALLYFAIYPLLISQFTANKKATYMSDKTALLLLNQIVNNIEYKPLLNAITEALIESELSVESKQAIETLPDDVRTYLKPWKPLEFTNDLDCKQL